MLNRCVVAVQTPGQTSLDQNCVNITWELSITGQAWNYFLKSQTRQTEGEWRSHLHLPECLCSLAVLRGCKSACVFSLNSAVPSSEGLLRETWIQQQVTDFKTFPPPAVVGTELSVDTCRTNQLHILIIIIIFFACLFMEGQLFCFIFLPRSRGVTLMLENWVSNLINDTTAQVLQHTDHEDKRGRSQMWSKLMLYIRGCQSHSINTVRLSGRL